jgi:hypothetical protein
MTFTSVQVPAFQGARLFNSRLRENDNAILAIPEVPVNAALQQIVRHQIRPAGPSDNRLVITNLLTVYHAARVPSTLVSIFRLC